MGGEEKRMNESFFIIQWHLFLTKMLINFQASLLLTFVTKSLTINTSRFVFDEEEVAYIQTVKTLMIL